MDAEPKNRDPVNMQGGLWDACICGFGYLWWPWSQSPEDTCGQLYNQNPRQTTSTQREDQEWQVPGRLTVIVTGI